MNRVAKIYGPAFNRGLRLDPKISVGEWATANRILTGEASDIVGPWSSATTPYLDEIMQVLSVDDPCDMVTFMKGCQVGGTECGLNWTGYVIDVAPASMLLVLPDLELAKRFSKQRLSGLIRNSPALCDIMDDDQFLRGGQKGNNLFIKEFDGGILQVTGANSPAGLRMSPVKFLYAEEIDGWCENAGNEGDPLYLAMQRTSRYKRKKVFLVSTPVDKETSRILRYFNRSDQRYYYVPCPQCNKMQILLWEQIHFEHYKYEIKSDVTFVCKGCGSFIEEKWKTPMFTAGAWRKHNAEKGKNPGFHLSSLYSPVGCKPWMEIAEEQMEWKKSKDEKKRKVWVNTNLGLPYSLDIKADIKTENLMSRKVEFTDKVMSEICLVTAGVDTQDNRLESQIIGWSRENQAFPIETRVFVGNPGEKKVWDALDDYLYTTVKTPQGELAIACTIVDAMGHNTTPVYNFCTPREDRYIFACKGYQVPAMPVIGKPFTNRGGGQLFMVGTDTVKNNLYSRLRIEQPGYGFIHFNKEFDEEYFNQLLGEKPVESRYKGRKVIKWEPTRRRQEALDTYVYATAALHALCYLAYPTMTMEQILDDLYNLQHGQELKYLEDETEEVYGEIDTGLGIVTM